MNCIEKKMCEKGATKIPSNLKIEESGAAALITLNAKRIYEKNMQESGNDFEGWSIAAHACTQKNIVLCAAGDLNIAGEYVGKGHLCRFLYRAMKFSEQYKWFQLSENLKNETDRFKSYLQSHKFTNNLGSGEAGNKDKHDNENKVEAQMAQEGVLRKIVKSVDIGNGKVYRQLPVGLFEDKVARDKAVFTGKKSAIDLWSRNENTISIVELKANNPMMGIVTEIFFYSNYIYDLVRSDGLFTLNVLPKGNENHRGYEEIWNNREQLSKVNGIMLADYGRRHPLIDEEFSKILNDNCMDTLNYYAESYDPKEIIQ